MESALVRRYQRAVSRVLDLRQAAGIPEEAVEGFGAAAVRYMRAMESSLIYERLRTLEGMSPAGASGLECYLAVLLREEDAKALLESLLVLHGFLMVYALDSFSVENAKVLEILDTLWGAPVEEVAAVLAALTCHLREAEEEREGVPPARLSWAELELLHLGRGGLPEESL